MKLKKIATFCLVILIAVCLVGCGEAKTSSAVGNNLNKTVDNLSGIINKLEEVNYNDIVINDINPLKDNTFNTVNRKYSQKSKWYTVGTIGENQSAKSNAKYVNADNNKVGFTNYENTDCENGDCYEYSNNKSYKPKYTNNVSSSFVRTSLDKYIGKIEVLYNDCADCISCEAECKNEKNILCQNINDCKTLCQKLKDGTIKLSENEIETCNEDIKLLENYSGRLNKTNGNIKTKVNNISKIKDNYNTQIDSVKQAYENLLEALETRLECYNDCNNTICKIQDVINKTNVNIKDAEKNKSNSSDINQNYTQKLDNVSNKTNKFGQGNYQNNYLNNNNKNSNLNQNNNNLNQTNKNSINNNFNNTNYRNNTAKSYNQNNTNQNMINNKNTQPPVETPIEQTLQNTNNYNDILNNQAKNNDYNNLNNNNIDNQNNNLNNNNIDNQNNNLNNGNNQNSVNQNKLNNKNLPNKNNQTPINNGYSQNPNYYGNNGYNNGYNTNYPPRNIDTYQNINKNIDTYRPQTPIYNNNYTNQYNQPINNQPTLKANDVDKNTDITNTIENTVKTDKNHNSTNINIVDTTKNNNKILSKNHVKDIYDKQIIDHQKKITKNNEPMAYPYNAKKLENNKKQNDKNIINQENIDKEYSIMTLEEPIKDNTMQSAELTENTDKNEDYAKNNNVSKTENYNMQNNQLTKDIKSKPQDSEFERNQIKNDNLTNKIDGHKHRELN